jgi:hypothetical protein
MNELLALVERAVRQRGPKKKLRMRGATRPRDGDP